MTETPEEIKAKARALRNNPKQKTGNPFGGDNFGKNKTKNQKPTAGVKTTMRKPSV